MEPPKSCPHLEVKFYNLRETKMNQEGISYRNIGWYCTWCKQKFMPVESEDSDGAKFKPAK